MVRGTFKKVIAVLLSAFMIAGMVQATPVKHAQAEASNTFKVLSLNVAGLPAILSSSNPSTNTIQMSQKLNNYDIVSVQEDFAYHNDLISQMTLPHQTEFSGNVPFGDGMNIFSRFPIYLSTRYTWNDRSGFITNGADQMTPKGILYTSIEIEDGFFIDVYNLHTDAGSDEGSYAARRSNMNQLGELIRQRSEGKAVIVIGDTNSRYTREQDNFEAAVVDACGLTDAWIQLKCNGIRPEDGEALFNYDNINSSEHEVVDKIWYRSGRNIDLNAIYYALLDTEFTDSEGNQLSDHYPITATFEYTLNETIKTRDSFGGGGGNGFSFLGTMSAMLPNQVAICTGSRLDSVSMTYDGNTISAGGSGGSRQEYTFEEGEYITSMQVSKAKKSLFGTYRISYIKLTTNLGHVIEGGTYKSNASMTFTAPDGYAIAGFHGNCADEIDRLGCIYLLVE